MAAELPADLVAGATHRRGRVEVYDSIAPAKTAMMVIDMQRAWTETGAPFATPGARGIIPTINAIAAALRARGGLVIWVSHTNAPPGAPGYWANYYDHFISADKRDAAITSLQEGAPLHALDPELDVRPADIRMTKWRFSAFARNPADPEAMLRARGIDTLIVAGVATNICCESTAREAMMRDFKVFMPHDAVTAPKADAHLAGLRSVMQVFADVRPAASLISLINA